jgi:NAD(P)-dependent dehydrogenase (short-subunit alcohol dehydrogenase family)
VTTPPKAVVVGASRGLGRALSLELARRGHDLVLAARSQSGLDDVAGAIAVAGGSARTVVCDLAADGVDELAPHTDADVLVLNAATLGPLEHVESLTARGLTAVLQVNVVAPAQCLRVFLPAMRRRGSGLVIAVSSSAAVLPRCAMAAYGSSKAAFELLMRSASAETSGSGVRVVTVRPGALDTDMQAELRAESSPLSASARWAAEHGLLHDPDDVAKRLLDRVAADPADLLDLGP